MLQLLDAGDSADRPQQAAQTAQGDAQVVQCLAIRARLQAGDRRHQRHLLADHLGQQFIDEPRHACSSPRPSRVGARTRRQGSARRNARRRNPGSSAPPCP